jgi:hypothetical protein
MGDNTVRRVGIVVTLGMFACVSRPELSGSALLLNMQPPPPRFAGSYDFDLLDTVQGRACATRSTSTSEASIYYWFVGADLEKLSPGALTSQSIGAAAFEALKNSPDADSIVVTRVVAEGHGPDKVCATIYGRGIKLRKAGEPSTPDPKSKDDLARPDK